MFSPRLDGVVSACHFHDGTSVPDILLPGWQTGPARTEELFLRRNAILWRRRLKGRFQ
jgi:hypothetical protein